MSSRHNAHKRASFTKIVCQFHEFSNLSINVFRLHQTEVVIVLPLPWYLRYFAETSLKKLVGTVLGRKNIVEVANPVRDDISVEIKDEVARVPLGMTYSNTMKKFFLAR
jgi:hypothetical protein